MDRLKRAARMGLVVVLAAVVVLIALKLIIHVVIGAVVALFTLVAIVIAALAIGYVAISVHRFRRRRTKAGTA